MVSIGSHGIPRQVLPLGPLGRCRRATVHKYRVYSTVCTVHTVQYSVHTTECTVLCALFPVAYLSRSFRWALSEGVVGQPHDGARVPPHLEEHASQVPRICGFICTVPYSIVLHCIVL